MYIKYISKLEVDISEDNNSKLNLVSPWPWAFGLDLPKVLKGSSALYLISMSIYTRKDQRKIVEYCNTILVAITKCQLALFVRLIICENLSFVNQILNFHNWTFTVNEWTILKGNYEDKFKLIYSWKFY